jgi:putative ABC transport system permease protein
MSTGELLRVAWESIARNKLRSLLTTLGIIIGVASVIIMISISAGTEAAIEDQITSLGSNLVFVTASFGRGGFGPGGGGDSGGLVYDDAFAIADEVSGVVGVVVEQNSSETVKVEGVILEGTSIVGSTPDFPSVRDIDIAQGRYLTEQDIERSAKIAVLGSSLATELFGDENPIGQTVMAGNVRLIVVGVLDEKGIVGDVDYDSRLYAPITVVFEKFTPSQFARIIGDRVRIIYVELAEDANIDDVIQQISFLLAKRHDVSLEEADFSVTTQQDIIQTQEATTEAFRNLLAWVAGVSLVVGGIGIMNIMLVSVTERTREIGIRQSVGATPNDIRSQFLTEALLMSLVGGLMGVMAGMAGSYIFGEVGEMRTVIVPTSILLAFSSAAVVGIFFGFYPANKAAQLDPIEALRHE